MFNTRSVPPIHFYDAENLCDRRLGSTAYQVHAAGFIFTEKLILKHPHETRENCNLKLVQCPLK
jgi:uncharacterized protein YpiB (UPF0302 family)